MKKIIFLFFILLGIVGCDMTTDIGPIVRITYEGVGVSGPSFVEVYPPGRDISIKVSLEEDCEIETIIIDGEMSSSKNNVINLYDVNKDRKIKIKGRKKLINSPTLNVTIPSDTIPYGGTATFSWIAEGEITSVTMNGATVSKTGSYTTPVLYVSKEYIFVVDGSGGSVTKSVSVIVGNWETSNFGMMTYDFFLLKEIRYVQDGWAYNWILTEDKKTDKYYFSTNYILRIYNISGESAGGPFNWCFIDDTHLKTGDQIYTFVLNKKFLILSKESQYNDKPAILEKIYYRPWL